eukprot:scaffold1912_cov135-Cylindrotheca_fusiformis.AAC.6
MPWFGRMLGILGGCTRSTSIQSTSSCRGGTTTTATSPFSTIAAAAAIHANLPFLVPHHHLLQRQQQHTLVLLPDLFAPRHGLSAQDCHPTRNFQSTFNHRSFWTTRGGEEQGKNATDVEEPPPPAAAATTTTITDPDQDHQTISLTYKQSFLDNPSASYPISVCTAQGFRSYMEDEYFYSQDGEFAAVFDGHGGQAVSRYLRKNLYASVQGFLPSPSIESSSSSISATTSDSDAETTTDDAMPSKRVSYSATVQDYKNAIASALDKVDREVQRISHWSYQGSTAVAIWLHEERISMPKEAAEDNNSNAEDEEETNTIITQKTIIAANVGDSRAVLCRNDTAYDLTRDHKPDDPIEAERIEASGGKVVWCGDRDASGSPILERGIYRVNGNLALSRAVGDRSERPYVTAEPEIIAAPIMEGVDDFIIVATDGLWDVFDSNDAVDFVLSLRQDGHQLERISTLVVEEALRRGTYDNITVLIIWLDQDLANKTKSVD